MNSTLIPREPRADSLPQAPSPTFRRPPGPTIAVGAFFACMGGVHIGLVAADPQFYGPFADGSSWAWVRAAWAEVFMADPAAWGLFAAGLEIFLAMLLLLGGRPAKLGWVGVIAFQVALVFFGWAFLLWSVPAAGVLFFAARASWPRL